MKSRSIDALSVSTKDVEATCDLSTDGEKPHAGSSSTNGSATREGATSASDCLALAHSKRSLAASASIVVVVVAESRYSNSSHLSRKEKVGAIFAKKGESSIMGRRQRWP